MSLRLLFVFSLLVITGRWALAFDMGPLNPYLESGASGPWTLTEQSGAAILDNRDADGDLTYFFVGPNSGEEGQREISVDIGLLRRSGFSKAGLLYGFENEPRSYFMFTVDDQATVRLEYRSPNGWEERMSSTVSGLNPEKISLTIREEGNQISLLVNGQERSSIGNNRMGRGAVGIVAVGIGTYSFSGFDVTVGGSGADTSTPVGPASQADENTASIQSDNRIPQQTSAGDAGASVHDGKLPDGVLHVKPVDIIDQQGFGQPVRAASMLIPADWSFDGKVHWIKDGCLKGTHIVYDAISPDNRSNISLLPTSTAQWSDLGPASNCTFLQADRAEAMIQPVINAVLQNTSIVKTERNPEITAMLQQAGVQDEGFRSWMDHIIATVDHDRNGGRNRATVLLYTRHIQMVLPMSNGPSESMVATALPVIFSAPVEHFDKYDSVQQLLSSSYQIDPQWQARMNKHQTVIRGDNHDTSVKIAEINRKANVDIAAIHASTQASVSESNDRSNRHVLEMLTETQTVLGSNGPVRVPAGTVWQAQNGSMFVSQNPAFDPNSVGVSAKKLTPIR